MFNLGMGEITVILLLALIFLGPKKLPDLASGLGKLIREIRKATSDVKNEIAIDETFRKPFEELRDAVTLHPDELKRRDQIKQALEEARRQAEELAQKVALSEASDGTAAAGPPAGEATADPGQEAVAAPPAVTPPAVVDAHVVSPSKSTLPDGNGPTGSAAVASAGPATLAAPAAPPPGTVAAPPTRLGPPRVTPPISSVDADAANKTQILSEEDLLPPSSPRRRPSTPPPLPGLPKAKKS